MPELIALAIHVDRERRCRRSEPLMAWARAIEGCVFPERLVLGAAPFALAYIPWRL